MKLRTLARFLPALVSLALFFPYSSHAQSLWIPRDRNLCVMAEFLKPKPEGTDERFLTSLSFLTARYAGSQLAVVAEVPYVHFESNDSWIFLSGESSSTIGNIYAGVERTQGIFLGELGVRVPLAKETESAAWFLGYVSEQARWNAFFPDLMTVQAAVNVREVTPSNIAYRLRLAPMVVIYTGEGDFYDTEIHFNYSWQVGYEGRVVRIGGALSGSIQASEAGGGFYGGENLGTRSRNQLDAHADFLAGSVRPGIDFLLPLGPEASLIPAVVGVSLRFVK